MSKAKQTHKKPMSKVVKQRVKHLLVPHKGNQYRPHITRHYGLTMVLAMALFIQIAYNFLSTGQFAVLGRASDISVSELLENTNKERQKQGLSALYLNDNLNRAAFLKAQDMIENNYWAHNSPSGITPWKWLADAEYSYDVAGENLAKNFPDAISTVDAWMASPTHKENILDSRYQDIGFAVVDGVIDGRQTTLVVAYYGTPSNGASVASANNEPERFQSGDVSGGLGNPLTYFGSALQSLSPATLGVLGLLAVAALAALATHHYRYKLPKSWRKSWKIHHGLYKFGGLAVLAIVIIFGTGGGQI